MFAVYLQEVVGRSPSEAALLYLPLPLAGAILAPIAGGLVTRLGGARRSAVLGVVVTLAGWLFMVSQLSPSGSLALLVAAGVVVVVGRVFATVAMTVSLTGALGAARRGLAAGLVTTAMELGLAMALAAIGGVLSALGAASGAEPLHEALATGTLVVAAPVAVALLLAIAVPHSTPAEPAARRRASH